MRNLWLNLGFCFVISFVVVLIYSTSTSILYTEPSAGDSAIFMTIGKYWAKGAIPYVDLWDSKGPMIFFINALGFTFLHSKYGIFIIQILSLSITAYFVFKLYRTTFNYIWSQCLTALSIFSIGMIYDGGNTAEEYLLPLITYSCYSLYRYCLKYEKEGHILHPARWAFIYGMVTSFSLMTRLTNAVGICIAVGFILVLLVIRKKWKNLFLNAITFIAGFLLLLVPFVIYFSSKDALDEMWYGTLFYNIDYAGKSGFSITGLRGFLGFVLRFVDSYFLVLVSLFLLFLGRNKMTALFWLFVSGGTLAWFFKSNGFGHYVLIALPYPCVAIVLLKSFCKECKERTYHVLLNAFVGGYTILVFAGCFYSYWLFDKLYRTNTNLMNCREMLHGLPADYKLSFLAYNCTPDLYLYSDTRPYCRFFTIQDWAIKCSSSLLPRVRTTLEEKTPKWFLLRGKPSYVIRDLLQSKYEVYKSSAGYTLYKHR